MVLTQAEINIIDGHYLSTLQRLLRLHKRTPRSIVYFLAGSLPACAMLRQRQMTLFSMICHLKDDPLQHHAQHVLLHHGSGSKSWFIQVRNICIQYGLPHPLKLLSNPIRKENFKTEIKAKVTEYWQKVLAAEASSLSSLSHFNPNMHLVTKPHPIWAAAGSNPYELNKSTILSRMISGRYRSERLTRFWTANREGFCLLPDCFRRGVYGDLEHLLLHCAELKAVREKLYQMWLEKSSALPPLRTFVSHVLQSSPQTKLKFILDPSSLPDIVKLGQIYGPTVLDIVLYMTRTYAYGLHREKLILIGRWPFATNSQNYRKIGNETNLFCVSGAPTGPDHRAEVVPDGQDVLEVSGGASSLAQYPIVPLALDLQLRPVSDPGQTEHASMGPVFITNVDIAPPSNVEPVSPRLFGSVAINFPAAIAQTPRSSYEQPSRRIKSISVDDQNFNPPFVGFGGGCSEVAHYQRPTDKQFDPGLPTCSGVHAGVTCGCLGGGGGRVAEDSCNPPKNLNY